MAIQQNSIVLKQDIANGLVSQNGSFQTYLASVPDYTVANIATLFNNAAYIKNVDPTVFCKTINTPNADDLFKINRKDLDPITNNELARFDTLSAMFLSTAISLTNIRYSSFKFVEKGTLWSENTYFKNVSLADNAILGNNSTFAFANNKNKGGSRIKSDFLIDTEDLFLTYGGIRDNLMSYRNSLIETSYNPNKDKVPHISASIIYNLSNLFIQALNKIRTELSCEFSEDNFGNKFTLTYYKEPNGTGGSKGLQFFKSEPTTVLTYTEVPTFSQHSGTFLGWSQIKSQKQPEFVAGNTIIMDNDYSLYPVFKERFKITYHADTASKIIQTTTANPREEDEGTRYAIEGIGNPNTVSHPLVFKNANQQNFFKNRFQKYTTRADGGGVYGIGNRITIDKNYNLYPHFNDYDTEALPLDLKMSWLAGGSSGSSQTNHTPYPLVIDLKSKFGVELNWFTHIKIEYTGYVNEMDHTHGCTIYGYAMQENTLLTSAQTLFEYSAGNEWSVYRVPERPYAEWPRRILTGNWIPLKNDSNIIKMYCYTIDDWPGQQSGSEGDVYICRIWLKIAT